MGVKIGEEKLSVLLFADDDTLRGTVSFLEIVFVGQCEVFVCL